MRLLQLSPCGVRLLLEHGQGGLPLLEGSFCVADGLLPCLEDDVLLREGDGERGDGCLLALKLSLLRLECLVLLTQLGSLLLDHLGLVLGRGSLPIALAAGLG